MRLLRPGRARRRASRWLALVVLALVAAVGCARPAPLPPLPPSPPPAAAPPRLGGAAPREPEVVLEPLAGPPAPRPSLSARQELRTARALELPNPLPTYPAELIQLALPAYEVVVRFVVDEQGQVASVAPSPLASSTHGPYSARFAAAVAAALASWRLPPAEVQTFFDARFRFEVHAGKPVVSSLGPAACPAEPLPP